MAEELKRTTPMTICDRCKRNNYICGAFCPKVSTNPRRFNTSIINNCADSCLVNLGLAPFGERSRTMRFGNHMLLSDFFPELYDPHSSLPSRYFTFIKVTDNTRAYSEVRTHIDTNCEIALLGTMPFQIYFNDEDPSPPATDQQTCLVANLFKKLYQDHKNGNCEACAAANMDFDLYMVKHKPDLVRDLIFKGFMRYSQYLQIEKELDLTCGTDCTCPVCLRKMETK